MDTYFKFKMFSEYIVPIALIIITIVALMFVCAISHVKEKRIKKFFESNGYERE